MAIADPPSFVAARCLLFLAVALLGSACLERRGFGEAYHATDVDGDGVWSDPDGADSGAPPSLTGVQPSSGGPFTTIRLQGENFQEGATVTVDGAACGFVTFTSIEEVQCVTPPHQPGSVDIAITNPGGQRSILVNGFTYEEAPGISSVDPPGGPLAGGTVIRILGANFVEGATVNVGGAACTSLAFVDDTEVQCATPAQVLAGAVNVILVNPDTRSAQLAAGFRYNNPPSVTQVEPVGGPLAGGTTLTIFGSNFLADITASVAAPTCSNASCRVPCTDVVLAPSTASLTCVAGAHATGPVHVRVENYDGQTGIRNNAFTYNPAPTLASVNPATSGAGDTITLVGNGFLGAPSLPVITLDGTPCTHVMVQSSASATCVTGAHALGAVDVQFTNYDGQSATLVNGFTYAPLTITGITPAMSLADVTTAVQITGIGFTSGASVQIDGALCGSLTYVSSTRLDCNAPVRSLSMSNGGLVSFSANVVVSQAGSAPATLANAFTFYKPGARDHQFGGGIVAYTNGSATFRGVAQQSDGKLVAVGVYATSVATQASDLNLRDIFVVRYTTEGVLDTSFGGGDGMVLVDYAGLRDEAFAVRVDASDQPIVVGFTETAVNQDVAIVRIASDGSTYEAVSFNMGYNEVATVVDIQPDGEIVFSGCRGVCNMHSGTSARTEPGALLVGRVTTGLILDTTFNSQGWASVFWDQDSAPGSQNTGTQVARGVHVSANGSTVNGILIAGYVWMPGAGIAGTNVFVSTALRFDSDGVLDATFNGSGARWYRNGTESIGFGSALVGGSLYLAEAVGMSPGKWGYGATRLNASTGAFDTTFSGDGFVQVLMGVSTAAANDAARSILVQPDGKIVMGGSAMIGLSGDGDEDIGLLRLSSGESLDSTFGTGGKVFTTRNATRERCQNILWQDIPGDPLGRIVCAGWTSSCDISTFQDECHYSSSDAVLIRYWP